MRKPDTHPVYTASAWLLQHLSYPLCRWYFFRLRAWTMSTGPLLTRVHKPVILATAPHLSHSDVIIVPAAIPLRLLPVRWLADRKIFNSRLKTLWFKLWGAIPINRDPSGSLEPEDIRWILEFAKQGKCIGVFPECCLVGGPFGDPHRDLVVSALKRGISVLPVGLARDTRTPRLSFLSSVECKSQVAIGDPLSDAAELLDALVSE